jgi:SAM-dependent methyltransferase
MPDVVIRDIKAKVRAMLEERQQLAAHDPQAGVRPSAFWSDFCSYSDYMLELPDESFSKLRLHTYHLTSDNYQTYYFEDAEDFARAKDLKSLTGGIPADLVLNEPEDGIGLRYPNGRFVSVDIIRYQKVVNTLYRQGVIAELSGRAKAQRVIVLEVGGGYGGLAHHLSRIVPRMTYVIVDLPETLLFSAAYLALHNPAKGLYVYDKGDFETAVHPGGIEGFDFVLIPNYRLDALKQMRFDLAINVASFQEMREEEVARYLEFIRETSRGVLYSWNQDAQPRNRELSDLSRMLRERFSITELVERERPRQRLRQTLKALAMRLRLLDMPRRERRPYREYVCRTLAASSNAPRP